jgi:PTS system N-acetylgalactosamine-specific IIB component
MPNIVLSRIDERLIHGQVGVQWVGFAGANLVLVANDEVAEDTVQQNLMEMVLAEGIAVRFWSLQKTIDNIHRAADRQKILLVCRTPTDFLKLVEGGCPSHASMWETCITPKANNKLPKRFLSTRTISAPLTV